MKRFTALLLAIALCVSLCACAGGSLRGKYISESGEYTLEFKSNGTCVWYEDGSFFNGTYYETGSGWQLNVNGSGLYSNTVFNAEKSGRDLIINGGMVHGELFIKQ